MADFLIDSIESFMLTLEKERNFSLHTIKAYKNDIDSIQLVFQLNMHIKMI